MKVAGRPDAASRVIMLAAGTVTFEPSAFSVNASTVSSVSMPSKNANCCWLRVAMALAARIVIRSVNRSVAVGLGGRVMWRANGMAWEGWGDWAGRAGGF